MNLVHPFWIVSLLLINSNNLLKESIINLTAIDIPLAIYPNNPNKYGKVFTIAGII